MSIPLILEYRDPIDVRAFTANILQYRTPVHCTCIYMSHLFCNALVHVIYSGVSGQCSLTISYCYSLIMNYLNEVCGAVPWKTIVLITICHMYPFAEVTKNITSRKHPRQKLVILYVCSVYTSIILHVSDCVPVTTFLSATIVKPSELDCSFEFCYSPSPG